MMAPDLKVLKANHWYHERDLRMTQEMFRSEAFISLTHTSKYVLQLFLSRREWHYEGKGRRRKPVFHNTGLKFLYREAVAYGIDSTQFRRCIKELIEHGFIEIAKQGGQLHGHKECSEYDLVDDWKHYGTSAFAPRTAPMGACFSDSISKYNQTRRATKRTRATAGDKTFSTDMGDS
jgi:hypothetical protein